ncbi:MAG TPA: hypothetical protein VMA98_10440 [Candidatus Acidoferrales bacterium]|nr:hypothetical protein [Candidatus Acidoferrales bacterium]
MTLKRPGLVPLLALGALALACITLATAAPAASPQPAPAAVASPAATPAPTLRPDDLLAKIRDVFRSHRPPPPFETYTIVRKQLTSYGYPDYNDTYTDHVWYRSSDHAALRRRISTLGDVGPMIFDRPIFNAATDPGPPTADVFEPAPLHTYAPTFVPTPEASLPPIIATVQVHAEFDYRVTSVVHEGDELHLTLVPRRDPQRNRLRELWVDAKSLELRKLVATDTLFVEGGPEYPVLFTMVFAMYEGIPIITHIHGVVYGGYDGDGQTVDYDFKDLVFPASLPEWYFNPRDYGQHLSEAPEPPGF